MEKYICCKRNLYFIVCILETVVSQTTDVTAAVGEKATILCSLPEQFPAFNGPDPTNPGSSVGYTLQDDPTINSVLPHKARLAVTDGNLVISNTQLSDAGSYKCSYGLSQIEIFLKVGKEDNHKISDEFLNFNQIQPQLLSCDPDESWKMQTTN